jgi:hypothetical protein
MQHIDEFEDVAAADKETVSLGESLQLKVGQNNVEDLAQSQQGTHH